VVVAKALVTAIDADVAADLEYAVYIDSNEKIRFRITDGSTLAETVSPTNAAIDIGNWYHIVARYDYVAGTRTNLNIFINGSAHSTNDVSTIIVRDYTLNFSVGNNSGVGNDANPASGYIDEVAIFNKALSQTEITDLYNSGNALGYNQ
jgi:MSHA biogenesis protein MshQ